MGKSTETDGKTSLLDALASVQTPAEMKKYNDLTELSDGMTMEELAVELNKGDDWMRVRLKALAAQGKLIIGKKRSTDLAGRDIWVPAYKFKE